MSILASLAAAAKVAAELEAAGHKLAYVSCDSYGGRAIQLASGHGAQPMPGAVWVKLGTAESPAWHWSVIIDGCKVYKGANNAEHARSLGCDAALLPPVPASLPVSPSEAVDGGFGGGE